MIKHTENEMIDEIIPLVKTKFHEKLPSYSVSRVDRFLQAAKKGPTCVCVVCNRCLYSRTVLEFKVDKHDFDLTNIVYKVNVICKVSQSRTSCCNKLGIF